MHGLILTACRSKPLAVGAPLSRKHGASVAGFMFGLVFRNRSVVITLGILECAVSRPEIVAYICLLGGHAALGSEGVFGRIKRNVAGLGMSNHQEHADPLFERPIAGFAFHSRYDIAACVDEIPGWPALTFVGGPDRAIQVGNHRPRQLEPPGSHANVVDAEAHGEFTEMHTHNF